MANEKRVDDEKRSGGWIARFGIPGLIASAVFFMFQQQQQAFDREQRILQSGWQFYSSSRTDLRYAGDGSREMAQLEIIGVAFPNIYCRVRQDIYKRASQVAKPGGVEESTKRLLIDAAEVDQLTADLATYDKPENQQVGNNMVEVWAQSMPWTSNDPKPCKPLNAAVGPAPTTPDATKPPPEASKPGDQIATAEPPVVPPPAAHSSGGRASANPPPPAASAPTSPPRSATSGSGAGSASSAGPAPPPPAPSIPEPKLVAAAERMRVFFHIPEDSSKERDVIVEGPRAVLADYNYEVVRTVARVPQYSFPSQAEVRYFGPEQEAAAKQLAGYLEYHLSKEGVRFRLNPIGDWAGKAVYSKRGMPPQNLEVWIPNPKLAS